MANFNRSSNFSGRTIDEDYMRRMAPSIFAEHAHDSRSARYTYIPTIDVVRAMTREGFNAVAMRQSNARDETKRDFTKHMVRFRREDTALTVGGTIPEVVLVNSHDGSSSYQLMAGLFRIKCLNGLVAQTATLEDIRVKHSGNVIDNVIEGSFRVIEESVKALAAPADWSQINLQREAQMALAESAHVLRFGDAEGETETPIKPVQLLSTRRFDDRANDLWTQFNVVQENVIRGGLTAVGRDANNRPRRSTTREVKGIDQDVRLNKALWVLGERMASLLKRAA